MHDGWLTHFYGEPLGAVEARLERGEALDYGWLRELDDDLWAILLAREYEAFPRLRAALPELPEAALQESWNGRSGMHLAGQSAEFYKKLKRQQARWGARPLADATVLDFGCGWGRLTRFLARDVGPGRLCGCDTNEWILAVAEEARVPARLARIDPSPSALPFDDPFDLIYAFSVFTHLPESIHLTCLRAIHDGLAPGGLLIATIRPPAYVGLALGEQLPRGAQRALERERPEYAFVGHGGAADYGEAVVNLPYVRERWGELFELLEVGLLLDDMYQVVLTLRRR